MKVLVTGGAGFIGRNFIRHLLQEGHDVTSVDPAHEHVSMCETSRFDIDCRRYFERSTKCPDLVIHAAANVGGREKIDYSPLWVAENLSIDQAMFAWALRTRPRKVVYLSSPAAYPIGNDWDDPIPEASLSFDPARGPMMPDNTYGWAKLTGELLALKAREAGLNVLVVRPFSGYGSDQSTDYPFGAFLDRIRNRADPFEIWGDGEQVRDWVHVSDIVLAVMSAVERDLHGPINIGTGLGTTFNVLAARMCDLAGHSAELLWLKDKPTGVRYRVADTTMLNTFYIPQTTLLEGIAKALGTL